MVFIHQLDIVHIQGPNKKKLFGVRAILGVRSRVFQEMLYGISTAFGSPQVDTHFYQICLRSQAIVVYQLMLKWTMFLNQKYFLHHNFFQSWILYLDISRLDRPHWNSKFFSLLLSYPVRGIKKAIKHLSGAK